MDFYGILCLRFFKVNNSVSEQNECMDHTIFRYILLYLYILKNIFSKVSFTFLVRFTSFFFAFSLVCCLLCCPVIVFGDSCLTLQSPCQEKGSELGPVVQKLTMSLVNVSLKL